jgi:hypothetical protein
MACHRVISCSAAAACLASEASATGGKVSLCSDTEAALSAWLNVSVAMTEANVWKSLNRVPKIGGKREDAIEMKEMGNADEGRINGASYTCADWGSRPMGKL